jgi:hypothetical protein
VFDIPANVPAQTISAIAALHDLTPWETATPCGKSGQLPALDSKEPDSAVEVGAFSLGKKRNFKDFWRD